MSIQRNHETEFAIITNAYIKGLPSVPLTGAIRLYESAKQWFNKSYPDATAVEYMDFVRRVIKRLGV